MPSFGFSTTGIEVAKAFAPIIKGKTILITGASPTSIGAETAISLAHSSPSHILLAGRSLTKTQPVIDAIAALNPSIAVHFVTLDLASQTAVREAAEKIKGLVEKIDVLVNCAGVMALNEFETTREGIEIQFGANHVGHFLLTCLLVEKLVGDGQGARVVNVSSNGFELGGVRFEDWNFQDGKVYDPWQAYAQSKTANVLFAGGLAEKLKSRGLLAYALQPGYVPSSNLAGHVTPDSWVNALQQASAASEGKVTDMEPAKTLQQGCATVLVAAVDPSIAGQSGGYLQDCVPRPIGKAYAEGKENTDKLWALSEKLVGEKFEF